MSDETLRWSNWSGRATCTPTAIVKPASVDEMRRAIGTSTGPVRAVGATHSHSAVAASNGLVLDLEDWVGVTQVDADAMTATVRSGTRIHQLGAPLRAHGLALRNQGDIDRQSVAGAVSTGTHGTGPTNQNLSASVSGFEMLLASGELVTSSPNDEVAFHGAGQLSLGAMGILTHVTLSLRPSYCLHERIWLEDLDSVMARFDELAAATRHFEFFWYPGQQRAICKSLAETDAAPDDMLDTPHERIGWSDRIISSTRSDLHTEMEYSLPAANGPACLAELRQLIADDFSDLGWPLEYRTVASDDVWLSPANARETVTISVHEGHGLDDEPLFRACESVFLAHGGRPHWGKVHFAHGAELAARHPRWSDWWQVRDDLDPDGRFVTDHLAWLRG